jgi:DNA-binding MarR family transcriptional regulator
MNDDKIKQTAISFLIMENMVITYLWPLKTDRDEKLNQTQMGTLGELSAHKKLNLTQLATQVSVTNQAMTGISNVLVEKGFVERVYDDTNRRQIELHLTSKGQEFVNRRGDEVVAAVSRIFSDLSSEEIETIGRASKEIYSILDKTAFGKKYKYKKEIEDIQREEHK